MCGGFLSREKEEINLRRLSKLIDNPRNECRDEVLVL